MTAALILAIWPLAIAAYAWAFGTLGRANDAPTLHYAEPGFFDRGGRSHGGKQGVRADC